MQKLGRSMNVNTILELCAGRKIPVEENKVIKIAEKMLDDARFWFW